MLRFAGGTARRVVGTWAGWIAGGALAATIGASAAHAIDFTKYHTQDEINAYMKGLEKEHPALAAAHVLGQSEQGREIGYVVLTHAGSGAPALYFNGTHHGDEWSSTESILGLIDYLVTHEKDADVAALLSKYSVYLQPLVNPDGHAAKTREDPEGRDPNRDYSYPQRDDDQSFHVPPIKLVKGLLDDVKFRAAAAYHSGEESVLWPWCYADTTADASATFHTVAKAFADAMGVDLVEQSYFDYPTNGEFIDYAYMRHNTLAVTVEVSNVKTPAARDLSGVVSRSVKGAVAFMKAIEALDSGKLALTPAPPPPLRFLDLRATATGERLE